MEHVNFISLSIFWNLSFIFISWTYAQIEVQTKCGKIRGKMSQVLPGKNVAEFLGVPYAQPPVGDLRFEKTAEPHCWDDVKMTTTLPPPCPQNPDMDYIRDHTPDFNRREEEDCLYLNIYVPQITVAGGIPVFVYIHGGSNRVGMGAMLRGDILASYGQIIVVNFNYRLGILGFYAAREEGLTGNYGFFDQITALKWVKENIAKFGGNPESITIAGHSAGAADVGLHVVSPLSKGLFHRAMIMSGSPMAFWGLAARHWRPGYNIDENCSSHLCPQTDVSTESFLLYLKKLKWEEFTKRENTPLPSDYHQVLTFPIAIVDGEFVVDRPEDAIMKGNYNCDSFVFSMTKDEGALDVENVLQMMNNDNKELTESSYRDVLDWYKPIYPNVSDLIELIIHEYGGWENFPDHKNKDTILKRYTQMESDIVFIAPMVKMADLLSASADNITVFSFDFRSPNAKSPEWQGIPHGMDLFYIFGIPLVGHKNHVYHQQDRDVSKMMMKMWSNFVKNGKFSLSGDKQLKPYSRDRSYNRLYVKNNNVVVEGFSNYRPRNMAFWNTLLPAISNYKSRDCNSGSALSSTSYNVQVSLFSIFVFCLIYLIKV